jgi:hypothetical protein
MSKINDDTNAPMGSGTTRGWKGWPSGPASKERFTQQGYPTSRLLTGERQAACSVAAQGQVAVHELATGPRALLLAEDDLGGTGVRVRRGQVGHHKIAHARGVAAVQHDSAMGTHGCSRHTTRATAGPVGIRDRLCHQPVMRFRSAP